MSVIREKIAALFATENLELLGVVDLDVKEAYQAFRRWVDQSKHGSMNYLERHEGLRSDPRSLLESAKVSLCFAFQYGVEEQGNLPKVAQYARFRDYHRTFKEAGERIVQRLKEAIDESFEYRVVVDSAPLLERALAAKTAQGFIGKNTCYIHPEKGSFLLLGEILLSLPLEPDSKTKVDPKIHAPHGGCGSCRECQIHCPTGALDDAYQIDARKCLSYWSIEHRGTVPEEYWPWFAKYYFGCDICQQVCPYNLKIDFPRTREGEREFPSLYKTAVMDQKAYEDYFGGTPLTRAKRNGLRRNALIAMAVTRDPKLPSAMEIARQDNEEPIASTLGQIQRYLA